LGAARGPSKERRDGLIEEKVQTYFITKKRSKGSNEEKRGGPGSGGARQLVVSWKDYCVIRKKKGPGEDFRIGGKVATR